MIRLGGEDWGGIDACNSHGKNREQREVEDGGKMGIAKFC